MNENYRDDICSCGATLTETVTPYSWSDHGFCSLRCAVQSAGGLRLHGKSAIEMAMHGGRFGGPGFETDIVREWIRGGTPNASPSLTRVSAEADMVRGSNESWAWRLFSGGQCRAFRLTRKATHCTNETATS